MFVARAPSIPELLEKLSSEELGEAIRSAAGARRGERYLHWDKLQHLDPPSGLSAEQWWCQIKLARESELRRLPLRDPAGQPFGFALPDHVLKHVHHIDQRCSGEVAMGEVVTSERESGQRFLVNSLMEEAIRSSQLEGATTSRQAAKEMLRSGREPRDRSERMIANNYRALQFMREEMGDTLTLDSILELHRILTAGTLDNPSAARNEDEHPIHRPPVAKELPERMDLLCTFANENDDSEPFIHPVVRAILLHFWLAYDHPFEDGNGRTARILFFWAM